MGYVERLLAPGETIRVRSRQHWIVLAGSAVSNAALVVAAVAFRLLIGMASRPSGSGVSWLDLAAGLVVAGAAGRFGWRLLQWRAEEYLVTSRRVIQTEGVLAKRTADSWLEKVNDVVLTQPLLGRVLGYGDLEIVTGSDIGVNRLTRLRDPVAFKAGMMESRARLGGVEGRPS
jgi:uncharacterized membrane protein YdbT with pleckstrin-like domain